MEELPNARATEPDAAPSAVMPPGWELVDWSRHRGVVSIEAERQSDRKRVTVRVDGLPAIFEADHLAWFKQVLDLKLLWAVS